MIEFPEPAPLPRGRCLRCKGELDRDWQWVCDPCRDVVERTGRYLPEKPPKEYPFDEGYGSRK